MRKTFDRLAAIVESCDEAIMTRTLDGAITSWNRAATRLFGYDPDEAIGRQVSMLVPPAHRAALDDVSARTAQGDRIEHFQAERLRKDGTTVDVSITTSPVTDSAGRIVEIAEIARAVSFEDERRRLAAIIDCSDDAIVSKTLAGVITSWNPGAERMFGWTAAEAIGRPITLIVPDERRAEEDDVLARIRRGEMVDHYETVRVTKDGRRLDISLTVSPIKTASGRVIGAAKIARDITGRKHLEARARDHAVLFRVMADTAPVMVWMSDPDGLCSFFNKAWLEFTGRPMGQELGNGWADGVHPDDLARCLDIYRGAFDARRPFRMEYRLRRADGQYRSILDTGVPRYTGSAEFAGYIGSAIDITDMNTAADTARAFFDSSAEGIVVVNEDGEILRVNPRGEEMFGYAHGELIGQPLEVLLPERVRAAHRGHRARYVANPRIRSMGRGLDLFGRRKDGDEFPIEISLSPILSAEGALAMALVTDITERLNVEQAARRHEKLAALATLSAGIAHELNNPIGIISTRLELMLQDVSSHPLPNDVVEDLQVLYRNIQRVTRIATGLLSFARQSPEEPGPVRLNAVIDETLLLLGRQLGKDGVKVAVTLDRTLGPVWGNANALQQVLTNLLFNARDAMPRGGEVRIETARDPDRVGWLRLCITDTGDGMRPEALKRIWEPFFTTKTSGTGLGLAVSHRIIREHGGLAEVQSEPGRGTTFTIVFPLHS